MTTQVKWHSLVKLFSFIKYINTSIIKTNFANITQKQIHTLNMLKFLAQKSSAYFPLHNQGLSDLLRYYIWRHRTDFLVPTLLARISERELQSIDLATLLHRSHSPHCLDSQCMCQVHLRQIFLSRRAGWLICQARTFAKREAQTLTDCIASRSYILLYLSVIDVTHWSQAGIFWMHRSIWNWLITSIRFQLHVLIAWESMNKSYIFFNGQYNVKNAEEWF